MKIKNVECSVHNNYKFYEFTIDFGKFSKQISNNEETEKIIKYFIMTNDKKYIINLDQMIVTQIVLEIMIIGLISHTLKTKQQ